MRCGLFLDTMHDMGVASRKIDGISDGSDAVVHKLDRGEISIRITIYENWMPCEQVVILCHKLSIDPLFFYEAARHRKTTGQI